MGRAGGSWSDRTGDDALVAAAQAGDRAALDRLLRSSYDRIWALCRRMTGNDADAQDAAQEALIAIARGLSRFDRRAAFSTWAYRVAANACLDELRRRQRRPVPSDSADAHLAGAGPAPEQVTDRLLVDRGLAALPQDFRAAVVLRDLCDLDYAEIATVLDIPLGTVRSRIARGRAQLAEHLRSSGNRPPTDRRPSPQP